MVEWFNNLSDSNKIAVIVPVTTAIVGGVVGLLKWRFSKKDHPIQKKPIYQNGKGHTAANVSGNKNIIAGGDIHVGIDTGELKQVLQEVLKGIGTTQSDEFASEVNELPNQKLIPQSEHQRDVRNEQLKNQFQLYGELWKALVKVRSSIFITPSLDRVPEGKSFYDVYKDRCDIAVDAFNIAKNIFEDNRPFFHNDVNTITKEFLGRCRGYIFKVQRALKNALDSGEFDDTLHDEADELIEIIPKAIDEIEKAIKIRIGLLPTPKTDDVVPIGQGLAHIAEITDGSITYTSNTLNFQPLIGLKMSIIGGYVKRNKSGKLEAYVQTDIPFQSLQSLNEKLGLDAMRLFSESDTISESINNPTVLTSTTNHILPQGESVLNLSTWQEEILPISIHVQTQTIASGYLEGKVFQGEFKAILAYEEIPLQMELSGDFQVSLS